MSKFSFFIFLSLSFLACKNQESSSQTLSDGVHFGETIDSTEMISYDNLLNQMIEVDSVESKIYGRVSSVCQTKGCWMRIVSDVDSTQSDMFVQFKDYGFFMPKDLAGKEVIMLGKAYRETTSIDDLKHFAEDEGVPAEEIAKITEPKIELKFMASGVKVK